MASKGLKMTLVRGEYQIDDDTTPCDLCGEDETNILLGKCMHCKQQCCIMCSTWITCRDCKVRIMICDDCFDQGQGITWIGDVRYAPKCEDVMRLKGGKVENVMMEFMGTMGKTYQP